MKLILPVGSTHTVVHNTHCAACTGHVTKGEGKGKGKGKGIRRKIERKGGRGKGRGGEGEGEGDATHRRDKGLVWKPTLG